MKRLFCTYAILAALLLTADTSSAGNIAGTLTTHGTRKVRDAIVYVDSIAGKIFEVPEEHAIMDQRNLTFLPHVLPVLAGGTVDFLNGDDVLHNVFTPDKCANKFNLGTWPKGEVRSYTFAKAGCEAVVLCNVHPEMEAYVVVLPTPYFARTDKRGNYLIEGVPAGHYTLRTWHEKLKSSDPAQLEVTVPAEGQVKADFAMKRK